MIQKQSIITPQIIKQRQDRHRKFMRMIKGYKRTNQEVARLQRIKDNTVLQINLRYIRSEPNKSYVFPRDQQQTQQEGQQGINPFKNKNSQLYDLKAQNQIVKSIIQNRPEQIYEIGRRIKSLDRQKNELQNQRIGRLQKQTNLYSYKKLRKSNSNVKRILSTIKLPELSKRQKDKNKDKNNDKQKEKDIQKQLYKQHLNTQTRNESFQFEKIIGKKLINSQFSSIKNHQKQQQKAKKEKYKLATQNISPKISPKMSPKNSPKNTGNNYLVDTLNSQQIQKQKQRQKQRRIQSPKIYEKQSAKSKIKTQQSSPRYKAQTQRQQQRQKNQQFLKLLKKKLITQQSTSEKLSKQVTARENERKSSKITNKNSQKKREVHNRNN